MATRKPVSMRWLMLYRSLEHSFSQTMGLLLALTVGTAMITAMSSVYFDIQAKMSQEVRAFGANMKVTSTEEHRLSAQDYAAIGATLKPQDVVASSPYLYGIVPSGTQQHVILGVDVTAIQALVPYWQVSGRWIEASFDERHVMLGYQLAQKLQLKVGDHVSLGGTRFQKEVVVRGIIEAGDDVDQQIVMNINLARRLLQQPDLVHYGYFSLNPKTQSVHTLVQDLQQRFPDVEIAPILQIASSEGALLEKMKALMGLIAVFMLVLSTLCVNITLMARISERQTEFALQKALGASPSDFVKQVVYEILVLGIFATGLGLGLGYILAQVLGQAVFNDFIQMRIEVIPLTAFVAYLQRWSPLSYRFDV